jgi:hypothetical protein
MSHEDTFRFLFKSSVDIVFASIFDGRLSYADIMDLNDGWINGNIGKDVLFVHSDSVFVKNISWLDVNGFWDFEYNHPISKNAPSYHSYLYGSPDRERIGTGKNEGSTNGFFVSDLVTSSPASNFEISFDISLHYNLSIYEQNNYYNTQYTTAEIQLFDGSGVLLQFGVNGYGLYISNQNGIVLQASKSIYGDFGDENSSLSNRGRIVIASQNGTINLKMYSCTNFNTPLVDVSAPFTGAIDNHKLISGVRGFGFNYVPSDSNPGFWDDVYSDGYFDGLMAKDNFFIRRLP